MSQNLISKKRIAILGASRGMGFSLAQKLMSESEGNHFFLASRNKNKKLNELKEKTKLQVQIVESDFSKLDEQSKVIAELNSFNPNWIFYVAGGGPHGRFSDKKWSDHQWALEVSFLFAARILHCALGWTSVQKIIFVGSAIAEQTKNNPLSPSYGAAKMALYSLLHSVQGQKPGTETLLFSPGYMDTELLPPNALPRRECNLLTPDYAAQELVDWVLKDKDHWHLTLNNPS